MNPTRQELGAVLIVEDEPLIRMEAVDIVEEEGFPTCDVATADEAIAVFDRRSDIGVLFTDIDMPGTMDGLELARAVRQRWPSVHVIIASGAVDVTQLDVPTGCNCFPKPYPVSDVRELLRRFAQQSAARD